MLRNSPLHLDFAIREFLYFFAKCKKNLTINNFVRVLGVGFRVYL